MATKRVSLVGFFSYIDDKKRLHILFLEDKPQSLNMLETFLPNGIFLPYTDKEFIVNLPSWAKRNIPSDIDDLIARNIKVDVSRQWYNFISPKGETVNGYRLILEDISLLK